jgi:predicted ATP-dependent endonuclease of OLD family
LSYTRVKNFKNIIDSSEVRIQADVTCFVGKNESGKTSFLHALYRLNPARKNVNFSIEDHYPAWLHKKDKQKGIDLEKVEPITATFQLDQSDIDKIENLFGQGVLSNQILTVSRNYKGVLNSSIEVNEKAFIKNLLSELSFTQETRSKVTGFKYLSELRNYLNQFASSDSSEKEMESIEKLKNRMEKIPKTAITAEWAVTAILQESVPKFIYFDKYSSLPYSIKIKEILNSNEEDLDDSDLTARSLLQMAAADDDYLLNPDYERRKRELENVANALTEDVLKYWSQNPELRVNPDITQATERRNNGSHAVIDELKIRIWDNKHSLSLPFNEHSTGFQWFFSFLAAFSEYEYSPQKIAILLDEPGLGLHGKAQSDFLKFIDERLAIETRQVIYTTHSPFMVQPDKLEKVRIVEEKSRDHGSKINEEIFSTDGDTLFPLQGALGYDLAQHLFVSHNNLIVEGTSDFTYISILSDFLRDSGKTCLDDKWTLVPVGGADLIPTFVALLGIHLDITVIIDARKEGNQKLSNLSNKGYLNSKRIIVLNEITGNPLSDIEDLFDTSDYLKIYNSTFQQKHKNEDLNGDDQIVNKIARKEGVKRFEHGKPADYFLRNRDKILPNLSENTLNNFEALFKRINETMNM